MTERKSKTRTIPYRILAALQFGQQSWVARQPFRDGTGLEIRILTGPAARALRVSNGRMIQQLEWLASRGLLLQLQWAPGRATAILPLPSYWNWATMEWAMRTLPGVDPITRLPLGSTLHPEPP